MLCGHRGVSVQLLLAWPPPAVPTSLQVLGLKPDATADLTLWPPALPYPSLFISSLFLCLAEQGGIFSTSLQECL